MACWGADRGQFGEFWVWLGLGEGKVFWGRGGFGKEEGVMGLIRLGLCGHSTSHRTWSLSRARVWCMSDELKCFEMGVKPSYFKGLEAWILATFWAHGLLSNLLYTIPCNTGSRDSRITSLMTCLLRSYNLITIREARCSLSILLHSQGSHVPFSLTDPRSRDQGISQPVVGRRFSTYGRLSHKCNSAVLTTDTPPFLGRTLRPS